MEGGIPLPGQQGGLGSVVNVIKQILVHFKLQKTNDDEFDIFVICIAHRVIYNTSCTRYAVRIQPRLASSETHHPSIACTPTGVTDT